MSNAGTERKYDLITRDLGTLVSTLKEMEINGYTDRRGNRFLNWAVGPKSIPYKKFSLIDQDGTYHLRFSYGNQRDVVKPISLRLKTTDNHFTFKSYNPLFIMESQLWRVKSGQESDPRPKLLSFEEVYFRIITDRLKQFLKNKVALGANLSADIDGFLRFAEEDVPNTFNARVRVKSRIALIPILGWLNKEEMSVIPWSFDWHQQYREGQKVFGDAFRPGRMPDLNGLDLMKEYFTVSPSSERVGQKGIFTCLTPEIQQLRGNKITDIYTEVGQEIGLDPDSGERIIYSMYGNSKNVIARMRLDISDGFLATEEALGNSLMDSNEKPFMKRFHNYLQPSRGSKHNTASINALVAYIPTDKEANRYAEDKEKFFRTNKDIVSHSLQGADGCILISEGLGKNQAFMNRTFRSNLVEQNFTSTFRQVMKQVREKGEAHVWENCEETHIAVYDECVQCSNLMVPTDDFGIKFVCLSCGHSVLGVGKKKFFDGKGNIIITGFRSRQIDQSDVEEGEEVVEGTEILDIYIRTITSVNGARAVGSGIKGITTMAEQQHVGYVYIEEIGETFPLDAIIPSNSNKGGDSAMKLAAARLGAIIQSYQDGELHSLDINSYLKNMKEANEFLDTNFSIVKRTVVRSKYNHKTGKIESKEPEELWVGVVQLKITEAGEEFVKTRESDTKVTFQLGTALHLLGKDALADALRKYSLSNIKDTALTEETAVELINILFDNDNKADRVSKIPTYEVSELRGAQLAEKTVQTKIPREVWDKIINESPVFTQDGYKEGFMINIKDGDQVLKLRFPSRELITKFASPTPDGQIWIPNFVACAFRLLLALQYDGAWMSQYYSYRKSLVKSLIGKWGVISRMLAYRGFSHGGKEFGSHLIPPGVAVINDERAWKKIAKLASEAGLGDRQELKHGKIPLYGFCIRDPFVWTFQACSAVELWNVQRANEYFQKEYGINYARFSGKENQGEAYYIDPIGICLNVLDMLYLYQSDADGDYRRLYIPFDQATQKEMGIFNKEMKDYRFINPYDVKKGDYQFNLVNTASEWHRKYVFGERMGDELDPGEVNTDKHSGDKLTYEVRAWPEKLLSDLHISSVKKKGMIAQVTTSLWKLTCVAEYLQQTGEITKEDKEAVIFLYQSDFLQDGCIRMLKHDNAFEAITIDKIGRNVPMTVDDGENTIPAQVLLTNESNIEKNLLNKFIYVCERYIQLLGYVIDQETGQYVLPENPNNKIGNMILAFSDFANGSRAGLVGKNGGIDPNKVKEFLKLLVSPESEMMYQKKAFEFILPAIQDNL